MIVRQITKNDLPVLAEIHKRTYERDHFSSRFTLKMLADYYACIISLNKYCYVAVSDEGEVMGIVMAGDNTKTSASEFTKKYWHKIIGILLLNPVFIFEKLKAFFSVYISKSYPVSKSKLRYLNMLVDPKFQGKGVAKALTTKLESDMKNDGYTQYGHSVKANNMKTIQFHLKNNCEIEFENKNHVFFLKKLS